MVPLWQVAHGVLLTIAWLKVVGIQPDALWQTSQFSIVGMWFAGSLLAATRVAEAWQLAQSRGVP